MALESSTTAEQSERLAAVLSFLTNSWGARLDSAVFSNSNHSVNGCFVGLPGPIEEILKRADAKVITDVKMPQARGATNDKRWVSGDLPHDVFFSATFRPAVQPGTYNVAIDLAAVAAGGRNAVFLEHSMTVCEEILGESLKQPEQLAYFIRRQLNRVPENARRLLAELLIMAAEEVQTMK